MFTWKDSFSVSNNEIDNQHKKLFEIGREIALLSKSANTNDCYDQINELILELAAYVKYHFKYEEELMKQKGYAELDSHIKEHEDFIFKISDITVMDIDNFQGIALADMLVFVADWIENHILKSDLKYRSCLGSSS